MIDVSQNLPESKKNTLNVRDAMLKMGELLDKTLKGTPPVVKNMTEHLSKAKGKGARALLLLTCSADENGLVPDAAVNAAAAIELFHLATLVHDDIIDDAGLRRGIETVHSKFGHKDAVICGDYLLCLAMSTLTPLLEESYVENNLNLFKSFSQALAGTCIGEIKEHNNNRNVNLSVLEYFRIISGKTASLFYISAFAGGIIGRCEPKEAKVLAKFGRNLGMIFQIVDDIKDYEFSEEKALKPVNNDILEGVLTLPLLLAMRKEPSLINFVQEAFDSVVSASQLYKKVTESGGLEEAKTLTQKYYSKTLKLLEKLKSSHKREELSEILKKALGAAEAF